MAEQKTVLIVEDEYYVYDLIRNCLLDTGYYVLAQATTYERGYEMTKRYQPDVIIMDIELSSVKNGIVLAYELADIYKIPIIFFTKVSDQRLDKIVSAYEWFFLPKPPEGVKYNSKWFDINIRQALAKTYPEAEDYDFKYRLGFPVKIDTADDPGIRYILYETIYVIRTYNKLPIDSETDYKYPKKHAIQLVTKSKTYHSPRNIGIAARQVPDYFVQADQGAIVNAKCIEKWKNSNTIILRDLGFEVGVARRRKAEVKRIMNKYFPKK